MRHGPDGLASVEGWTAQHQDHRSDPHRRLLRHTYQEGPGFLFLATRGGRPPGPRSARTWRRCGSASAASARAQEEGTAAALALGVSPGEPAPLAGAPCSGRHRGAAPATTQDRPGSALPAWVEQAVIVVRLLTYWNSKRLAAEFTRRDIWPLGHHAVDALLAEPGHGATIGPPGARPGLRARPAQRAVAHRHQGPLLPAACAGRVHEGLDRRPRRRPLPLPHRPARPAPAPERADPRLAARLLRAVRACRSSS